MTTRRKPIPKSTKLLSLRQAKTRFRFDSNRDDHARGHPTVNVFVPSHPSLDCGVYGAAMAVLAGYALYLTGNKTHTVRLQEGAHILGRIVEVSREELARLDAVAEVATNCHRFLAEVKSPQTGYDFAAWVFQDLVDMTHVEEATSAIHSDTVKTLQLA